MKKNSSPSSVKNPGKTAVFVFYCSCNKNYKSSGSKQDKFMILKFNRSETQELSDQAKIEMSIGLCFFLEGVGESLSPSHPHFLEATHIPWLIDPFLHPQ